MRQTFEKFENVLDAIQEAWNYNWETGRKATCMYYAKGHYWVVLKL